MKKLNEADELKLSTLWLNITGKRKRAKPWHQRNPKKALPIQSALKALVCIHVANKSERYVSDIHFDVILERLFSVYKMLFQYGEKYLEFMNKIGFLRSVFLNLITN